MKCPNKKCKGEMIPEFIVYICPKCEDKGFVIKYEDWKKVIEDVVKGLMEGKFEWGMQY